MRLGVLLGLAKLQDRAAASGSSLDAAPFSEELPVWLIQAMPVEIIVATLVRSCLEPHFSRALRRPGADGTATDITVTTTTVIGIAERQDPRVPGRRWGLLVLLTPLWL